MAGLGKGLKGGGELFKRTEDAAPPAPIPATTPATTPVAANAHLQQTISPHDHASAPPSMHGAAPAAMQPSTSAAMLRPGGAEAPIAPSPAMGQSALQQMHIDADAQDGKPAEVRKHIVLPEPLSERLRKFCYEQRAKEAPVIRQALDRFLADAGY